MRNHPCPFCASENLEHDMGNKYRGTTPAWITCTECLATGPAIYVTDKQLNQSFRPAMIEWNKRAPVDIQGE